ncbi:MAG: hypothetical protein JWM27_2519 [Gemmatimonadetes bacterium]|nr:hypothetical protein [Gemmatimonadota bacterium]
MHSATVIRRSLVVVAAALAHAGLAAAQGDTVPAPSHSVAVTVGSGPGFEVWQRLSPRVEAGLALSGSASRSHGDGSQLHTTTFAVGPQVKVYAGPGLSVRPFLYAGAFFSRTRAAWVQDPRQTNTLNGASATLGAGLEWSPVPRVAIGGFAGLSAGRDRATVRQESVPEPIEARMDSRFVGIVQSGIRAQYRF